MISLHPLKQKKKQKLQNLNKKNTSVVISGNNSLVRTGNKIAIVNKILSKKIKKIYDNGSVYVGEMKNGLRHGQGTCTYASGVEYKGEWKDDKRHGQGAATWDSGNKYMGEWKNSERNGYGTLINKNGLKKVGQFKAGFLNIN